MYFPASTVTDGSPMKSPLGFAWALNLSFHWVLVMEEGSERWRKVVFVSRSVGMKGEGFGKWRECESEWVILLETIFSDLENGNAVTC